jgi:hypothetical protein
LVLLLAGCSRLGPLPDDGVSRIDGRSQEAFVASVRRMKQDLAFPARDRFTDSIAKLQSAVSVETLQARGPDFAAIERAMRERLHGMSIADVVAAADRVLPPRR